MFKIFVLLVIFTFSCAAFNRPTNDWEIVLDDNQRVIKEAETIEEATAWARKTFGDGVQIISVSRYSYVRVRWIWPTTAQ